MDEFTVWRHALKVYMNGRMILRYIALLLLAGLTLLAGVEPFSWTKVALAALFLCAYVATLQSTRETPSRE